MTRSSILSICLLITVTAISACTPWHVKYGIPEGADMKAPENTAKLIEVMRLDDGWDSYMAAELLVNADPAVTAPHMAEMFQALSIYCKFDPAMVTSHAVDDESEDGELQHDQAGSSTNNDGINNYSCPLLARAAKQHGASAAPNLTRLNPYAAMTTLGALGTDGRAAAHTVIATLGSPHAIIRIQAAEALLKIQYPSREAIRALAITSTADADPAVREAAARSHRTLSSMELAETLHEQPS